MTPPRRWLGAGLPILALYAALGSFAGAGTYVFTYAQGFSYLQNDPKACVNCHIMREQYDGWLKAGHHAVATCNDCHVPEGGLSKWVSKADNGIWHSAKFTLQNFHEPIRIRPVNSRILNQNCVRCHAGLVDEIADPRSHGGEGLDCIRCHADVGHGPTR